MVHMKWRFISWTALSALMHLLVLILPFTIMAVPVHQHALDKVIPVKMVGPLPAAQASSAAEVNGSYTKEGTDKVDQNVQSGNDKQPEPLTITSDKKVTADYYTFLKARASNAWKYPEEAIRRGEEGRVTVSFLLNEKGELMDIGILQSSGSGSLDDAVISAVRRGSPYGPLPEPSRFTANFVYVLD